MDFDNLHQVLRNLYQEMMPLCGDMIGVAKGIAGLGALFYVAYRVWKALASAEPIDVFPLLRPFAIGLCVMFFPTVVLGTINAVMSPVVQGTHAILEGQTLDLQAYQQQKDDLEAEARRREGKAWLVDDEVYEQRLADMGITDLGEIISMWAERTWYDIKAGFRQLVRDFFELLFNAAGLTIDTLRTFFLVVLSILGPLSFALSIYDGFHSTLASWISRYISVYLWLPIADLFSAVLAKIQTLMLQADVLALQDPNYIPDSGSGVYIIFLIIGIIGYFTIPTVAEWVIQSGGAGGAMGGEFTVEEKENKMFDVNGRLELQDGTELEFSYSGALVVDNLSSEGRPADELELPQSELAEDVTVTLLPTEGYLTFWPSFFYEYPDFDYVYIQLYSDNNYMNCIDLGLIVDKTKSDGETLPVGKYPMMNRYPSEFASLSKASVAAFAIKTDTNPMIRYGCWYVTNYATNNPLVDGEVEVLSFDAETNAIHLRFELKDNAETPHTVSGEFEGTLSQI